MDDKEMTRVDLVSQNPLLHSVVLRNLFSFMKNEDVKTARLVCREWNDNATIELNSRQEWITLHDLPAIPKSPGKGRKQDFHTVDGFLELNLEQSIMYNQGLKCLDFRRISLFQFQFETSFLKFFESVGLNLTHLSIGIISYTDGHSLLAHMPFQMPHVKSLRMNLIAPNNSSLQRKTSYEYDEARKNPSGKSFVNNNLESFSITDFSTASGSPELEWSLILDTCPKLQNLTLATNGGVTRHMIKLMSDFGAAYAGNRNIQYLKLRTKDSTRLANFPRGYADRFAAFINLFQLKKLQFGALMPGDDLNQVFRSINPPSEKLCLIRLIGSERSLMNNFFKVLSPIGGSAFNAPKHLELHCLQDEYEADEWIWGSGTGVMNVIPGIVSLNINTMQVGKWTNTVVEEAMKLIPKALPNVVKVSAAFKTASSLRTLLRNFTELKKLRELDITCNATGRWAVTGSDLFGTVDRFHASSYLGLKGLLKLTKLTLRMKNTRITGKKVTGGFSQLPMLKNLRIPESWDDMIDEENMKQLKSKMELRFI